MKTSHQPPHPARGWPPPPACASERALRHRRGVRLGDRTRGAARAALRRHRVGGPARMRCSGPRAGVCWQRGGVFDIGSLLPATVCGFRCGCPSRPVPPKPSAYTALQTLQTPRVIIRQQHPTIGTPHHRNTPPCRDDVSCIPPPHGAHQQLCKPPRRARRAHPCSAVGLGAGSCPARTAAANIGMRPNNPHRAPANVDQANSVRSAHRLQPFCARRS